MTTKNNFPNPILCDKNDLDTIKQENKFKLSDTELSTLECGIIYQILPFLRDSKFFIPLSHNKEYDDIFVRDKDEGNPIKLQNHSLITNPKYLYFKQKLDIKKNTMLDVWLDSEKFKLNNTKAMIFKLYLWYYKSDENQLYYPYDDNDTIVYKGDINNLYKSPKNTSWFGGKNKSKNGGKKNGGKKNKTKKSKKYNKKSIK